MRAVFDSYIGTREKFIVTDKLLIGAAAASTPPREDVLTATATELPRVNEAKGLAEKRAVVRSDMTAGGHVPDRDLSSRGSSSVGTAAGDRITPATSHVVQKEAAQTPPQPAAVHANGSLSSPLDVAAATEHRNTFVFTQHRHIASAASPDTREPQVRAGEPSNTGKDAQPQAKRPSAAMAATSPTGGMASKRAKTDATPGEVQTSAAAEVAPPSPLPVDASQLSQDMDADETPEQIEHLAQDVPSATDGPTAVDFIASGHATVAQGNGPPFMLPLVGEGPLLPGQERKESEASDVPRSIFLRDLDDDGADQVVSSTIAKLLSALSSGDVPEDAPQGHCRTCGDEATAGGLPVCQPCWTAASVVLSQKHGVDSHASFWREGVPPFPLPAGITLPRTELRIFATEVGVQWGITLSPFGVVPTV
jgi:hypothetical protein